jgi:hypothetical protein
MPFQTANINDNNLNEPSKYTLTKQNASSLTQNASSSNIQPIIGYINESIFGSYTQNKYENFVNDNSNSSIPTLISVNDFNKNMYPSFDPTSQYVGVYTNIDAIHDSTDVSSGSINPADTNWLGVISTQNAIDNGSMKGNEVYKISYPSVVPPSIVDDFHNKNK